MWIPGSAEQLIEAIAEARLAPESASYEYKVALPASSANKDIAIDVAAMATDGGLIIYGVGENGRGVTFSAEPIDLTGVKDRISDVVTSQIKERFDFDIRPLPLSGDPSRGFVLVDVPASIRAPHMVEVRGEFRFYGRVPEATSR
jgi:hypothetical protein